MDDLQKCVEHTQSLGNLENMQNLVQNEMQTLQNRFQRCHDSCRDVATDALQAGGSKMKTSKQEKIQKKYENCATLCEKNMMPTFKAMAKRVEENLAQIL